MGISSIFSRSNADRATWVTFILALVINVLLLFFYRRPGYDLKDEDADPSLLEGHASVNAEVAFAINVLNTVQAVFAAFVLLLYLVVRIPTKYQSLCENEKLSTVEVYLYTAAEPMTVYYICYLAFCIMGNILSYDFLPFLLLDLVVKNNTLQDVLNAIVVPRKQLVMGFLMILFICQIYAFFLFMYFRNDILQNNGYCDTLFGCYLVSFGYGLRGGGGVGDTFHTTIGSRWLLDVSYYMVITLGMLNLVAGVIITTFGQLREEKAKREKDTITVCFICGIDKQVFDRAADEPNGFQTHIKVDHNIWNYMFFIFLLWEQDKDDDDGLEQYVRRAINKNEIVWFPLNKAIRLDHARNEEDSLCNELKKSVSHGEHLIASKLDRFQTEVQVVLEQLNLVLKQDMVGPAAALATATGFSKGGKNSKAMSAGVSSSSSNTNNSKDNSSYPSLNDDFESSLGVGSDGGALAGKSLFITLPSLSGFENVDRKKASDMLLLVRVSSNSNSNSTNNNSSSNNTNSTTNSSNNDIRLELKIKSISENGDLILNNTALQLWPPSLASTPSPPTTTSTNTNTSTADDNAQKVETLRVFFQLVLLSGTGSMVSLDVGSVKLSALMIADGLLVECVGKVGSAGAGSVLKLSVLPEMK